MSLFDNEVYSKCLGRTDKIRPAFYSFNPGTRNIYIIHYVYKGKGFLQVNDKTYSISTGESFIIYPGYRVSYYPDLEDPWEYEWVNFTGGEAEALLSATCFSPDNVVLPATNDSPLKFFRQLSTELEYAEKHYANPDLWYCLGNAYLRIILAYYIAHYPNQKKKTSGSDYADSLAAFINENINSTALSVELLSQKFSLSRSSLFRIFKKHFGCSPIVYINELRMKTAANFLRDTNYTVKVIALSVGFDNSMYFSKVFKTYYGMTPSDYRKNKN